MGIRTDTTLTWLPVAILIYLPMYFVLASLTNLTSYTCYRSIWTDPPLRRNGR